MINATLLRIDLPDVPDAGGGLAWIEGDAIAERVAMGDPTGNQKLQLGATIKDATAVMYRRNALPATMPVGAKVVAQIDGRAEKSYRVIKVIDQMKPGLAHLEAYLVEVKS